MSLRVSVLLAASLVGGATLPGHAPAQVKPSAGGTPLRVMTFNIKSGLYGLEKVAHVIEETWPDVVALQEVDVGARRSGRVDQPARLAAATGLQHRAYFQATTKSHGAYGVALLSRFPLERRAQYRLPVPPGAEPRTLGHVVVTVGGQDVSLYVTHLIQMPFHDGARAAQTQAISGVLARDARPKLLLGDFNDFADGAALAGLRAQLQDVFAAVGQGPEGTLPLPFRQAWRIDYIFACKSFV
ncbi:MAG TPA: endonuclease/exonuclease/phosphatase family protein, partial [Candidatus Polarisedimenticolaceae bacterium]|nr:endonuclease/exonuclease/phosphatase family protein [Candidatus Polarisedimenticolaceae bacterium]